MMRLPGLAEVACRARQGAGKLLERAMPPVPPSARAATTPAFFAGPFDAAVAGRIAREFPEHRDAIVAEAGRILAGEFDLLGYTRLSFGQPVDWQWDVVSNRRCPLHHWSQIDPLDEGLVGDHKVPWELSRQQWLVTLALAWRLTGDHRFALGALRSFHEWVTANPHGMGLNWASSLEVAIRLMSWSWMLVLLDGAGGMPGRWRDRVARAIAAHAAHVERYLSHYFSPNTHLTGEALGLLVAAAVVDSRRSGGWRARGLSILEAEAQRQILPDGVYVEQATAYHRYTAEIYLQALLLGQAAGRPLSPAIGARVAALLDALLALCRPDGSLLAIGDGDGGGLLPFGRRAPDDCRGLFAVAAAVFGRPDYAWAAGGVTPETLWLLGTAGARRMEALAPQPPARAPSTVLPAGGYVVMRTSWQADAHQLVFDVGPLGCCSSGAHGHADLLSVHVSPFGEPAIVDPGTGEYSERRGYRTHFRGTAAHSTVRVDGLDQALPAGPFAWRGARPAARLTAVTLRPGAEYADARHDAFRTPLGVVAHRRRVCALGGHGWIVVDDLEGTGRHAVELRWQFAPLAVLVDGDALIATLRSGRALTVVPVALNPWHLRVARGGESPDEGWVSPAYGVRVPAPQAVYSETLTLPARLATLLLPSETPPANRPVLAADADVRGQLSRVHVPMLRLTVAIDDAGVRICAA